MRMSPVLVTPSRRPTSSIRSMQTLAKIAALGALLALGACASVPAPADVGQVAAKSPFMPSGASVAAPRGYSDMCRDRPQLCEMTRTIRVAAQVAPEAGAQVAPAVLADASAGRRIDATSATFATQALAERDAQLPAAGAPQLSPAAWTPSAGAVSAAADEANGPPEPPLAVRLKMLGAVNRLVNSRVRQVSDWDNYGVEEYWTRTGIGTGAAGDCEDIAIEKREQLVSAGYPERDLFYAVAYRSDLGLHAVLVARTEMGDLVLDSRTPYVAPWYEAPYVWIKHQEPGRPSSWSVAAPRPAQAQWASLDNRAAAASLAR